MNKFLLLIFTLCLCYSSLAQKNPPAKWRQVPKKWEKSRQWIPDIWQPVTKPEPWKEVPEGWEHVYDSVYIVATHTGSGSTSQMWLYDTPPTDIIFPLPTGTYKIDMGTALKPSEYGSYYMDFQLQTDAILVKQGQEIIIPSSAAVQALILIDTNMVDTPPMLSYWANDQPDSTATGIAFDMWKSQGYYYAYIRPDIPWHLNGKEYFFTPKAGEVWKLNYVKISYDDSGMYSDTVRYSPPTIQIIEAEHFAETGGKFNDPTSQGGTSGVKVSRGVVTYFNAFDWIMYDSINIQGQTQLVVRYAYGLLTATDRYMEIHLNDVTGPLLGSAPALPTGGWETFQDLRIPLSGYDWGTQGSNVKLYLLCVGPNDAGPTTYWGNIDVMALGSDLPPPTVQHIEAEEFTSWYNLRYSTEAVLPPPAKGVGGVATTSWISYKTVNLTGVKKITFRRSGIFDNRKMDIRVGSTTGQIIGTFNSTSTGTWNNFVTTDVPITTIAGTFDLYFTFRDDAVLDWDWFELSKVDYIAPSATLNNGYEQDDPHKRDHHRHGPGRDRSERR